MIKAQEGDKTLTCQDCGNEFIFTVREQEFYASKGFTEPKRCFNCRKIKKQKRDNQRGGEQYQ